ncbi:MAG TPA: zinc-binding dehydrogenase, partial [Acidimicrobiia bacterium]
GILIALVAGHAGADVLVSEVSPFRRNLATELGLRNIDPATEDLNATVSAWSDGKGADVAFEVSGSAAGVRALTDVLAVRGHGVVVAIHTEPTPVDLMAAFWKELDISGARVYQRDDFEAAVALLADGVIPAQSLITEVVPLSEADRAFDRIESGGEVVKVMIDSR